MTELYSEADYIDSKKQKTFWLTFYIVAAVLFVAASVLIAIFLRQVSYAWGMFTNIVLTCIFGAWSLFFFAIKFRLTNKYCRMLKYIKRGLKETTQGKFLNFDEAITDKEGVSFAALIFEEKVKKRPDMPERRVLLDCTRPRPDFTEGDIVKYTTHASIMMAYEVIKKSDAPPPPLSAPSIDAADGKEKKTESEKKSQTQEIIEKKAEL